MDPASRGEATERRRHQRAKDLFEAALEQAVPEREAFLKEHCAGDADLQREVEGLLAFADDHTRFLQRTTPAGGASEPPPAVEGPLPERIGPFRILSKLGDGGMGTVYEARQDHPDRSVALKVLRTGMMSPQLLSRFEQEGQLLARLQHSGIAHVYQSGTASTDLGEQPYFAMELVRGQPLTHYAAARGLDVEARLELVRQVCDAVAHAHTNGVVHRDLKPSNILVDEGGRPHVLDFGVARLLDEDPEGQAVRTQTGQVIGTPSYMSPEQASGLPERVDTRSDVFALGVLTFELLTGRLPRDFTGLSYPEMMRRVSEGDTSLLGTVDRAFRGDLEIVVAKAMAHERERRYASAHELAADLGRYLRSEPITARPATALYHMRRFVRRHRSLSASLAGLFLVLVTGTVVSLALLFESQAAEREAHWQSYVGNLMAANESLESGLARDARLRLEAAPEEFRGWEWRFLMNRLEGSLRASERGPTNVRALAVHPDGETFVAAGGSEANLPGAPDYGIRSYRVDTLELVRELTHAHDRRSGGPRTAVRQLAYGPGGLELVSLARDRVLLSDAGSGETIGEITAPYALVGFGATRGFCAFAIHPDPIERRIFVARADEGRGSLLLWNGEGDPRPLRTLAAIPTALALSRDGSMLAAGDEDGRVALWKTADLLSSSTAPVTSELDLRLGNGDPNYVGLHGIATLDFSRHDDRLAVATSGGCIAIVDAPRGEILGSHVTGQPVAKVRFVGNEGAYASTGLDANLRLWSAGGELLETLFGHDEVIGGLAVTPDGARIVTGALDRTLRLWEARPGAAQAAVRGERHVFINNHQLAIDPAGEKLARTHSFDIGHASGVRANEIRILDARSGAPLVTLPGLAWHGGFGPGVTARMAFTPDGSRLVVHSFNDRVRVWDVATGELVHASDRPWLLVTPSADGERLFEARLADGTPLGPRWGMLKDAEDYDFVVRCVRMEDGDDVLWEHSIRGGYFASILASEDGRRLYSSDYRGRILVWDAGRGKPTYELQAPETGPTAIWPSSSGRLLVSVYRENVGLGSAGTERTVRIWDMEAGEVLQEVALPVTLSASIAFIDGDERLVFGAVDGSITVVDPRRGPIVRLAGHTDATTSLAFAGERLASFDQGATMWIRDATPASTRSAARAEAARFEALRPEVEPLVDALFERLVLRAEVVAALQEDATLDDEHREAALRVARTRSLWANFYYGHPFWRAWEIARDPDAGDAEYERALRILDFIADLLPGPDFRLLAIRGYACIRLGRFEEGLEWLEESKSVPPTQVLPSFATGPRTTAIFQAMAEVELDRTEDANRTLDPILQVERQLPPFQRELLEELVGPLGSE